MNPQMLTLPEVRSWRQGIDPAEAERQIRWLREQIAAADLAIEAQQRIIAADGPLDAYLLSIDSLRRAQAEHEHALSSIMRERDVEVLDFALDGKKYAGHRAQAKHLSLFLDTMQRLFERVGQALAVSNPGPIIAPEIRQLCQLEVAGFFPSSFGVRFAAPTRADLTGSSLASQALEATFDLVNAENPLDQAALLGQRAMIQYRHLVTTLIKAEATPKVAWRQPDGQERRWVTDDNALLVLANRLAKIHDTAPRTIVATGTLIGASLRRRKFEFAGPGGVITGKTPKELAEKITKHFGKACRITYAETVFIDETTDQEKRSRVMLDIEKA